MIKISLKKRVPKKQARFDYCSANVRSQVPLNSKVVPAVMAERATKEEVQNCFLGLTWAEHTKHSLKWGIGAEGALFWCSADRRGEAKQIFLVWIHTCFSKSIWKFWACLYWGMLFCNIYEMCRHYFPKYMSKSLMRLHCSVWLVRKVL